MTTNHQRAKFPLGRIVATPAALQVLNGDPLLPLQLLARHVTGTSAKSIVTINTPTSARSSTVPASSPPTPSMARSCG
jgi:hypothetical protein